MCGICGEATFLGQPASVQAVAAMSGCMTARGPDGDGIVSRGRVAFGHRRLKIIDLSEKAEQPMVDPTLGLTVVFNGCIYNHRELRAELEAKGFTFFSDGDTEVIVKGWKAWGTELPNKLFGMFAIAIHERDSGRVILIRDRLGIKPLYVSEGNGRLRFASSLPSLLAAGGVDTSIDPAALNAYMTFHSVVPAPRTILSGVRKLPPATLKIWEPDGRTKEMVYWSVSYERSAADVGRSFDEWREEVHASLRTAVKRRMVADVPVGVLLSGGVDSSVVVALLSELGHERIETFSIGFEARGGEEGDEFKYSDIIVDRFKTSHHKIMIEERRMLDALPGAIQAMSEPMVSHDCVAFYLLSEEVRKYVTVVQSGQGADEIFAGYHWYPKVADSNDPVAAYAEAFFDRDNDRFNAHVTNEYGGADHARAFVEEHFATPGADDAVDKALRLDSTVMLVDDPVKRVDNMTMAHSLEARVPFLDHELVELAARIPGQHKLADGGKGVLKDLARHIVPKEVVDRPKGYFPVPGLKYLEGKTLEMVRDALGSRAARERGLFRQDYLDALFEDPTAHITPLKGSELWQCALLEVWLQTHGV
ncbi:N-acetylglutaminylglutamine amidotransferase [Hansschlegelia zhihuaiae]|uniref:asparagine synthase (glutamine-hydrolyzing) n=1 Tax=Hansschlegelia zhihuaiae TaxID=405005 RepID=A0A4Q0MIY0_9HYPH|nr:N-acetylglutaminylglutamine amidotransferase [Hansschlegelia zhihuaiae]RXF73637.1 N-acetylglutaminylglutamine amidotransferase [Hansschlegelia zhihuaiae]